MRIQLTLALVALALAPAAAKAAPASMLNTPAPAPATEPQPSAEAGRFSWLTKWFRNEKPEEIPQFVRPVESRPPVMAYQPPAPPAREAWSSAPTAPEVMPPSTPLATATPVTSAPSSDCKSLRDAGHEKDRAGDLAAAEALYRQAIAADPTSSAAVNDLGLCLARQGKLEVSSAVFRQAITMRPDKHLYRNNVATVLVELDQTDEALANLKAVYRPAAAHFNLGQLLARAGKTTEAVAQLRESLSLEPTLAPAREALASLTPQPPALAEAPPQPTLPPADPAPPVAAPAFAPAQVASVPRATAPPVAAPTPAVRAGTTPPASFPRLLPPVLGH